MHYIKIMAIALVLFVCSNCCGQLEFSLNNDSILKSAHVKTEIYYSFFSPTDSAIYCINNYDTLGYIVSSKMFSKKGKLLKADSLIYNNEKQLLKKIIYNDAGKINATNDYEYDSCGNCITINEYNNLGKNTCSSSYTFNKGGNILFTKQITTNKTYFKTAQFFYNNTDDLEKIIYAYNNGDSTSETYSYRNHLCNSLISDRKQLKRTEFYDYNINGRLTEITVTTSTFKKNKTGFRKLYFEYDSYGLCTQRLTFVLSGLDEKTKCYYTFY